MEKEEKLPEKKPILLPKELSANSVFTYSIVIIFVMVFTIGIFQINWNFFSNIGTGEMPAIKIGLPWTFFELDLDNVEKIPIKFGYFFIDLLIYIIIAYLINIAVNVFVNVFVSALSKKKPVVKI